MNPAAQIVIAALERGWIDFKFARKTENREQIRIGTQWRAALVTY